MLLLCTLKALKLEFEKFWTNVTASAEKLGVTVGKPKIEKASTAPIKISNLHIVFPHIVSSLE